MSVCLKEALNNSISILNEELKPLYAIQTETQYRTWVARSSYPDSMGSCSGRSSTSSSSTCCVSNNASVASLSPNLDGGRAGHALCTRLLENVKTSLADIVSELLKNESLDQKALPLISINHLRVIYTAVEILWCVGLQDFIYRVSGLKLPASPIPKAQLVRSNVIKYLASSNCPDEITVGQQEKAIHGRKIVDAYRATNLIKQVIFNDNFSNIMLCRNLDRVILAFISLSDFSSTYRISNSSSEETLSRFSDAAEDHSGLLIADADAALNDIVSSPFKATVVTKLRVFSKGPAYIRSRASRMLTEVLLSESGGLEAVLVGYLADCLESAHLPKLQMQVAKLVTSVPENMDKVYYYKSIARQLRVLMLDGLFNSDTAMLRVAVMILARIAQLDAQVCERELLLPMGAPLLAPVGVPAPAPTEFYEKSPSNTGATPLGVGTDAGQGHSLKSIYDCYTQSSTDATTENLKAPKSSSVNTAFLSSPANAHLSHVMYGSATVQAAVRMLHGVVTSCPLSPPLLRCLSASNITQAVLKLLLHLLSAETPQQDMPRAGQESEQKECQQNSASFTGLVWEIAWEILRRQGTYATPAIIDAAFKQSNAHAQVQFYTNSQGDTCVLLESASGTNLAAGTSQALELGELLRAVKARETGELSGLVPDAAQTGGSAADASISEAMPQDDVTDSASAVAMLVNLLEAHSGSGPSEPGGSQPGPGHDRELTAAMGSSHSSAEASREPTSARYIGSELYLQALLAYLRKGNFLDGGVAAAHLACKTGGGDRGGGVHADRHTDSMEKCCIEQEKGSAWVTDTDSHGGQLGAASGAALFLSLQQQVPPEVLLRDGWRILKLLGSIIEDYADKCSEQCTVSADVYSLARSQDAQSTRSNGAMSAVDPDELQAIKPRPLIEILPSRKDKSAATSGVNAPEEGDSEMVEWEEEAEENGNDRDGSDSDAVACCAVELLAGIVGLGQTRRLPREEHLLARLVEPLQRIALLAPAGTVPESNSPTDIHATDHCDSSDSCDISAAAADLALMLIHRATSAIGAHGGHGESQAQMQAKVPPTQALKSSDGSSAPHDNEADVESAWAENTSLMAEDGILTAPSLGECVRALRGPDFWGASSPVSRAYGCRLLCKWLRAHAAHAVARYPEKELCRAVEALVLLLSDADSFVYLNALIALRELAAFHSSYVFERLLDVFCAEPEPPQAAQKDPPRETAKGPASRVPGQGGGLSEQIEQYDANHVAWDTGRRRRAMVGEALLLIMRALAAGAGAAALSSGTHPHLAATTGTGTAGTRSSTWHPLQKQLQRLVSCCIKIARRRPSAAEVLAVEALADLRAMRMRAAQQLPRTEHGDTPDGSTTHPATAGTAAVNPARALSAPPATSDPFLSGMQLEAAATAAADGEILRQSSVSLLAEALATAHAWTGLTATGLAGDVLDVVEGVLQLERWYSESSRATRRAAAFLVSHLLVSCTEELWQQHLCASGGESEIGRRTPTYLRRLYAIMLRYKTDADSVVRFHLEGALRFLRNAMKHLLDDFSRDPSIPDMLKIYSPLDCVLQSS